MNTKNRDEFDYQAYMKDNAPDLTQVICGPEARQQRRKLAKTRITIRIGDVVSSIEFKGLSKNVK